MGLVLYLGDIQFSSWSMRARIAIREKAVDCEEILVELDWPVKLTKTGFIGLSDSELAMREISEASSSGCCCDAPYIFSLDKTGLLENSSLEIIPRVPVLVDTELSAVVYDSLAICEYIEEKFSSKNYPSLLPQELALRGEIRSFCSHIHSDYMAFLAQMSYGKSFMSPDISDVCDLVMKQASQLAKLLEGILSKRTLNQPFIFGNFSVADVMLSPIAQQFVGWKFPLDDYPELLKYFHCLLERDSISAHLNEVKNLYTLDKWQKNSPQWISRHYRWNEKLRLIHNWRTNIFHKLENDVAWEFFVNAFNGIELDEFSLTIAKKYCISVDEVKIDALDFFALISPERDEKINSVFYYGRFYKWSLRYIRTCKENV